MSNLERALAYCEKHQILGFFDHPDLHLYDDHICIDDQAHIVISRGVEPPVGLAERFDVDAFDYTITLQTHMDRLCEKLKLPTCADAGRLYDALRAKAKQQGEANLALAAHQEHDYYSEEE